MNDFSDHIGIIGAGISGLALGCTLAKEGYSSIIFEKNNELGSHGAGISISPNGLKVFKSLGLEESLNHSSKLGLTSENALIGFVQGSCFLQNGGSRGFL